MRPPAYLAVEIHAQQLTGRRLTPTELFPTSLV